MDETILPTPEKLRQLLRYEPETGHLYWLPREGGPREEGFNTLRAGKRAGFPLSNGRLQIFVIGYKLYVHRVVWAIHYGVWPSYNIDHVNGDPSDNRITNLRDVTQLENAHNRGRSKNNKSGYANVTADGKKWFAGFKHCGRHVFVGRFDSPEEASRAVRSRQAELGFTPRHGL